MGTGLGPSWFTPEFPALAARRDPFPDVERWQTTFVRYSASETAHAQGWEADSCRRNLHSMGVNDHPILRQNGIPDAINMRIIEAPAEFALPVKQDRRLLPCFKVRLEVQHRGAVSLPVTLRAHVLSQQDKEQIATWVPPDDANGRDDKGQKAATELKGTAFIRCTLEAGSAGEIRPVGMGGKDGQSLPQSTNGGSTAFAFSAALRGAERIIKPEPSYNGAAAATAGLGPAGGGGGRVGGGLHHDQNMLDPPYGLAAEPGTGGLGVNGTLRDLAPAGLHGPGARDVVGLGNLFAANRPDPVITLASSGRMSATDSSLSGLGGAGGLRLNPGTDPRDSFDAAVEMLMQPSSQQHQQQRRAWQLQGMPEPGSNGGGSQLLSEMQRQLQQRQEEQQGQRLLHQHQQQQDRSSSATCGGGKLITATQDFEFTNLEFLKPTRMNKVYMAFTASILDADLLFVVFNVPTIGICRAEQREKACKKLHIDYRLLSHFDQGIGADRLEAAAAASAAAAAAAAAAAGVSPNASGGRGGGSGPSLESRLSTQSGKQGQGKGPAQQQQPLPPQQQQQHSVPQEHKGFTPQPLSPSPSMLSSGAAGVGVGGKFLSQRQDSGRLQAQLSDTDFPRMPSGLDVSQQQHHQQQQSLQQQHQQQQQRMAGGCGTPGMQTGGGSGLVGSLGGEGLLGCGGGMSGGALPPHAALSNGGLAPNGSISLNDLAAGGLGGSVGLGGGGGLGSRMLPGGLGPFGMGGNGMGGNGMGGNGMGGGGGGPDFFFGGGSVMNGGGGLHGGMPGGLGGGMGGGMSLNGGGMGLGGALGCHGSLGLGAMLGAGGGNSRKRDQGPKDEDNYRFQPVQPQELPSYQGFIGLTSSDVDMLLPAPHSRMAMRDFINEVYDGTGLHRKLTHMDMQALLSQAGFPMDSNREHDTISPQQWDEFCAQFRSIVNTLQQVASVWNMEDPVVISGFDMDRAGTITALVNEPAGTFICRFSMSQPGCLVLTCKVGNVHPRADAMGLIHAIIKIDDLNERRVDTWIRDYAGATHLLDVYRQKRVDKRKVFATNYTRLRGLEVGEQSPPPPPLGMGPVGYV